MKKTKDEILFVLKAHYLGDSAQAIESQIGIPKSTVQRIVSRSLQADINFVKALQMDEASLMEVFAPKRRTVLDYSEPDWEDVYLQFAGGVRKISLRTLWQEYVRNTPAGARCLSYPAFCKNFQAFAACLPSKLEEVTMTFHWPPADVVMIDYSGDGIDVSRPDGSRYTAQIFVGVLPHSDYIFCYATEDQTRHSWMKAVVEMFKYFGGVPSYVYLDNSTSLVKKADRFNPVNSADFQALCDFYHTVAYACRPGEPRDKALVEGAVNIVQRKILNPLYGEFFPSIGNLNEALRLKLEQLNQLPMVEKHKTRRELFDEERKLLTPLPTRPYIFDSVTKFLKVRSDYRIRHENRRFSVPYRYAGQTVKVVINPHENTLECFDPRTDESIAKHHLGDTCKDHLLIEHMPEKHLALVRTLPTLIDMIAVAGINAKQMAQRIVQTQPNRIARRLLNGLLSQLNKSGRVLFEQCCREELKRPEPSYAGLVLRMEQKTGISTQDIQLAHGVKLETPQQQKNIRGSEYFAEARARKDQKRKEQ